MGVEIERKFLVDKDKWAHVIKPTGTHYRQGYLLDEAKRIIRVRTTDKQGFLTIKGITNGITRKEYEYKIPVEEGVELLDAFAESEVEKIRYKITFEGKLWEVDEFHGDNTGLLMAEIELQHEDEAFIKPDWITIEVSNDGRYYNSNLSKNPFKNWGNKS
ncbi:CYTH domain-containing protein [Mucilaginibacter frigoritolerans]|uniref:CYTH domain-containing protein n=1 Tax=Mucilaginibacter frigoritolerans TaxID=652788 RepID=A0A562TT07_9SPHI|nr:CYTH domain-containing protein [Mucilaginibacter frigoritolerans]TWI96682.1 CYTH domain-containing protein [Mucilaginibacter frigoritolerans]